MATTAEIKDRKYSKDDLRKTYRIALIIYCAGIAAVGIYCFVAVTILRSGSHTAANDPNSIHTMRYILYTVSVLQILSVNFVKKLFLSSGSMNITLQSLVSRQLVACIIAMALCEAAAIYGLVLSIMSQQIFDMNISAGLALFGLLLYFPRFQQWEEALTKRGVMLV